MTGGKGGDTLLVADTRAGDKPADASAHMSVPVEDKPKEAPPVLRADNSAGYEGDENPAVAATRFKMALSRARRADRKLPITRRALYNNPGRYCSVHMVLLQAV